MTYILTRHNGDITKLLAHKDDGTFVGGITLDEGTYRGALVVAGLNVDEDARGARIGTQLYEAALKEACTRGKELVSDTHRSPYAEAFWRKQAKKRRAKCFERGRGTVYFGPIREVRSRLLAECRQQRFDLPWAEKCADARLKAITVNLPLPKVHKDAMGESKTWPCYRWGIPRDRCTQSLDGLEGRNGPGNRVRAGLPASTPWAWLAAGGGAAALLLLAGRAALEPNSRWTWGRPNGKDPWGNIIYRDPNGVVPAFADKIELVIRRLRARGYDAVVAEAYRTPARALKLSEGGTGAALSLHSYNGAVDIVDRKLGWSASTAFKNAVVEEVERAGLMSGRRFSNRDDWAHAQAVQSAKVPVFIAANLQTRNAMVA